MQYIHVKNLEKFHPGYQDRKLVWAKIYFDTLHGDTDCEMIENEVDWARLIKFIILELQAKKPIPISENYLLKKGFNLNERKIELTLQALSKFVEITENPVTETEESVTENNISCTKRREDKEEDKEKSKSKSNEILSKWNSFVETRPSLSKVLVLTKKRNDKLVSRLSEPNFSFDEILVAIEKQPFLILGSQSSEDHRNWRISFDWLITNDTNYVKVLELVYADKKTGAVDKKTDKQYAPKWV